jgi:putative endonuclease
MARTRESGQDAEDRACVFLENSGLRVVERNFHCRAGEIDLIMRDRETLVFVEVRLRTRHEWGGAAASVDGRKQRRLIQAAQLYLQRSNWRGPCRFDVLGFDGAADPDWIRDAFSG